MAEEFRWVKSEFKRLKLFRLPTGPLKNAQFRLLRLHGDQLNENPDGFPLPYEERTRLRDTWLSAQEHGGKKILILHALAVAKGSDMKFQANDMAEKLQKLREKLEEEGIRTRIHISTYKNEPPEMDSPLKSLLGKHYTGLESHINKHLTEFHGLHSIVMRLELPENAADAKLDSLKGTLQAWRSSAYIETVHIPVEQRLLGVAKPKPRNTTVNARVSTRTDEERMRAARKRREKREGDQLKFPFIHEPIHQIIQ